jgi:hypothetical protein
MAKRIQRKRTAGWKLPENTVCVTRPSIWGNPFNAKKYGTEHATLLFKKHIIEHFGKFLPTHHGKFQATEGQAKQLGYTGALTGAPFMNELQKYLLPLVGKDLACWCKEGSEHCHADVWLRLAEWYGQYINATKIWEPKLQLQDIEIPKEIGDDSRKG